MEAGTMTAVAAPERSLEQRRAALRLANDVRSRRADLKRKMKKGRVSSFDQLASPPRYIETMKVFDLLLSMPKVGRVKADKTLRQCRISPSKTVGGLSERQRREILALLGGRSRA